MTIIYGSINAKIENINIHTYIHNIFIYNMNIDNIALMKIQQLPKELENLINSNRTFLLFHVSP